MTTVGSDHSGDAPFAYRTRRVHALGHWFEVESTDRALGQYVETLFAAMATGPPARGHDPAVVRYAVVERSDGWELLADGRSVVCTAAAPTVLATLLWDVNRSVVQRTAGLLLLHAAAAERDGVAVVLPGAMEAGKTTMVAGLVRAGLRYLTDEVTAIEVARDWIHPYPKALSVDPGSWPLLGDLEPAVPQAARRFLPEQWQVVPSSIRADAVAAGARPRLVVLPRYERGAATRLRPLARADALVAVSGCAFRFEDDAGGTIRELAHVLSGCDTYELVHSDLDAAVSTVLDALGRVARVPARDPEAAGSAADASGRRARAPREDAARSPEDGSRGEGQPMARTITPEEIGPGFAPRRHPGLTSVELDGEVVLYSGEGAMHKLDAIASVLWNCFDGSVTLAELVEDLDSVYRDVAAERITGDVLACVRELGRQGLLANVAAPGGHDHPGGQGGEL